MKKVKTISTKGLTKDFIKKFSILNGSKHFYSGIFQNYLIFKSDTGISKKKIENITKSDNNFAPTFVDNPVLPDTNVNGRCSINNISIPNQNKQKKQIHIFLAH